jgi:hypothetical protein
MDCKMTLMQQQFAAPAVLCGSESWKVINGNKREVSRRELQQDTGWLVENLMRQYDKI